MIRSCPLAPLAKKIVVCEGKTEESLCRALDNHWEATHAGQSLAYWGVVAVNGEGCTQAPASALNFRQLGYDVMYFGDSDKPLSPDEAALRTSGVTLVLWSDNVSTEERVALDLPLETLASLVRAAIEHCGEQTILNQIGQDLGQNLYQAGRTVGDWIGRFPEARIRDAIGKAARNGGWFKGIERGLALGEIVTKALGDIPGKPLAQEISKIEAWVYGQR